MSELKEHLFCECDEIVREYRGQLSNEMRPYYLKSEADKVIAHQKFKRCLAMAMNCLTEKAHWHYRYNDFGDKGYTREYKWHKVEFWCRWGRRWLELAEKFKEAK